MFLKARFTMAAALLLLLMPLLAACGEPQVTSQPTAVGQPTTASGTGNAPTTVNVEMNGIKFVPAEITITAGSTVVWTNKEAPPHTVTEDNNAFDSGTLKKGGTFQRTFDTPATISYFCTIHGKGMSGKVIVTAATGAGGGSDTPVVADNTPTEAAAPPTAVVEPPTVAPVLPTATILPPQATDTPAPPAVSGSLRFRDDTATSDQAVIAIDTLPAKVQGKAQYAWLTNGANGSSVNLGRVTPNATGGFALNYSTPDKANLLALYDGFKLTNEELETTPKTPSADVVLSGSLPPNSLIHIRHLLVSFEDTPNKIGLEVGLLSQIDLMKQHAQYMKESQAGGNLAGVKLHAEHLVNIIEGNKGADFGDLNKDGKVTNPGDGYGLLQGGEQFGYLLGSKDHAELAATASDATDDIKLHAGHVGVTVDNVTGWVTPIRDKSLEVLKATTIAETAPLVADIFKFANQARDGVDLQGDGQILPIPGSGGALTSYQHAQLIATVKIVAGAGSIAPTTPVVEAPPTAVPPTVAVAPTVAQAANGTTVSMKDFKFVGGPITVKLGTTITWTNDDKAPHTATADSNVFDSGILQTGQNFSFTPKAAGEIKYYCALHGGPDGQGMSSVITVQP